MADAQVVEPPGGEVELRRGELLVLSYGVVEPLRHDMEAEGVSAVEVEVHLGRHVAYAPLDVPDALARASAAAEKAEVVGVALRIVGMDEREEG